MTDKHEITRLLVAFRGGDRAAFDQLFSLVYDELRRRAHFQLRQAGGASLATTALVHEAYLKLVGGASPDWEGRRHFYRIAARVMRQIVIDHARRQLAVKRGGGRVRLDIDRTPRRWPMTSAATWAAAPCALGRTSGRTARRGSSDVTR